MLYPIFIKDGKKFIIPFEGSSNSDEFYAKQEAQEKEFQCLSYYRELDFRSTYQCVYMTQNMVDSLRYMQLGSLTIKIVD